MLSQPKRKKVFKPLCDCSGQLFFKIAPSSEDILTSQAFRFLFIPSIQGFPFLTETSVHLQKILLQITWHFQLSALGQFKITLIHYLLGPEVFTFSNDFVDSVFCPDFLYVDIHICIHTCKKSFLYSEALRFLSWVKTGALKPLSEVCAWTSQVICQWYPKPVTLISSVCPHVENQEAHCPGEHWKRKRKAPS